MTTDPDPFHPPTPQQLLAFARTEVDPVEVEVDGVRIRLDGATYQVLDVDIEGDEDNTRLRRIADAAVEAFNAAMRSALDRNIERMEQAFASGPGSTTTIDGDHPT